MKNTICEGIAIFLAVAMGIFFGWVLFGSNTPPVEVEYGELMAQTNSIATFFNEDRGFFTIAVGELLELYEDYVIVYDTCGTADRTDDIILSISKEVG